MHDGVRYEQVEMDIVHHRTLSDLRRRVNSKERIVGWYACSACLALVFQTHLSELVHYTHQVWILTDTKSGSIQIVWAEHNSMHCRYSTGQGVSGSDARFQMYYETQCQNPVSLLEA